MYGWLSRLGMLCKHSRNKNNAGAKESGKMLRGAMSTGLRKHMADQTGANTDELWVKRRILGVPIR